MGRTPTLEYRVQKVSLPGIVLGSIDAPTPFTVIPMSGNIEFNPLRLSFHIGENMKDYLEVFNWMVDIGQPERLGKSYPDKITETVSDITITVLNNSSKPILAFTFFDAFPIALSDVDFDIAVPEVNYLTASATFKYLRYEVQDVT